MIFFNDKKNTFDFLTAYEDKYDLCLTWNFDSCELVITVHDPAVYDKVLEAVYKYKEKLDQQAY